MTAATTPQDLDPRRWVALTLLTLVLIRTREHGPIAEPTMLERS